MNIAAVMLRQGCGLVLAEAQEIGISGTARACAAYAVANPAVGATVALGFGTLVLAGYAYRRCRPTSAAEHAEIADVAAGRFPQSRPASPRAKDTELNAAPIAVPMPSATAVAPASGASKKTERLYMSLPHKNVLEYNAAERPKVASMTIKFSDADDISPNFAAKVKVAYPNLVSLKLRYHGKGELPALPAGFKEALSSETRFTYCKRSTADVKTADASARALAASAAAAEATQPANA